MICKNRFVMALIVPLGMPDCEGEYIQRGIEYYTACTRCGAHYHPGTSMDEIIERHSLPNFPNPAHFVRMGLKLTK